MSRIKVYVSAPVSNGDVEQNVRNACKAAAELIKLGYAPLVPQLTAYLQSPVASLSAGFSHETWMEVDLPWVEVANVVLRLPGLSRGADREVAHALAKGIPVFYSIEEMQRKYSMPTPKAEEWKVGDKFTCGCGRKDCKNGEVRTISYVSDGYVHDGLLAFSMAHIKRIPPAQPLPPLPKGGSVTVPSRKAQPVATGVLSYFPDALKAVAHCSYVGNEQHNPGQALHWNRELSTDEADAMIRHFLERGKIDTDGVRHSAKVAWRALALLQKEIEASCVS